MQYRVCQDDEKYKESRLVNTTIAHADRFAAECAMCRTGSDIERSVQDSQIRMYRVDAELPLRVESANGCDNSVPYAQDFAA